MNKKYTIFLSALFFTSIIMAAEDPDETNTKTPHDASKIVPGSEEAEKHPLNKSNQNYRWGRKRRRQSIASERQQITEQQKKS